MNATDQQIGTPLQKGERLSLHEGCSILIDAAAPITLTVIRSQQGVSSQIITYPGLEGKTEERTVYAIDLSERHLQAVLAEGTSISFAAEAANKLPSLLVTASSPRRHFAIANPAHSAIEMISVYRHSSGLRMKASGEGCAGGLQSLLQILK